MPFYESTIKCPYCFKDPLIHWKTTELFEEDRESDLAKQIYYNECPICRKLIVGVQYGQKGWAFGKHNVDTPIFEEIVYPQYSRTMKPDYIPENLYGEYKESIDVLPVSRKSSAAMSRRILQNIIREHYAISERTLDAEIHKFISLPSIPTYISDAVDAVRWIGNIAAHPLKNSETGVVVDVEDGEAEWLVEVIEALFDFTFVQPKKLEARRNDLNEKLASLGKPKLKSGK